MQHCAGSISAESLYRNKTCTVLHQVGVSFDLYYDARKHKIKKYKLSSSYHYHITSSVLNPNILLKAPAFKYRDLHPSVGSNPHKEAK